ncbi:MAG: hypothetical protein M3Q45_09895 [Chloroflexota bacterium]|nr:hypothetical protein [Chloroflexota bacterium]
MLHQIRSSYLWAALRIVAIFTLLALMLPAIPAQAAPNAASASGVLTFIPLNPKCYLDGVAYPLGTTKPAGPEFYRKCELVWQTDSLGYSRLVAVWKIYPK